MRNKNTCKCKNFPPYLRFHTIILKYDKHLNHYHFKFDGIKMLLRGYFELIKFTKSTIPVLLYYRNVCFDSFISNDILFGLLKTKPQYEE